MIYFTDNAFTFVPEDLESKDTTLTVDLESTDTIAPEDLESTDTIVPEDLESKDTIVPEDLDSTDTTVLDVRSATGETQQSATPTIINDIVVPDNSYSKYCFFFLMLLFALFVGRSFRKGV